MTLASVSIALDDDDRTERVKQFEFAANIPNTIGQVWSRRRTPISIRPAADDRGQLSMVCGPLSRSGPRRRPALSALPMPINTWVWSSSAGRWSVRCVGTRTVMAGGGDHLDNAIATVPMKSCGVVSVPGRTGSKSTYRRWPGGLPADGSR